MGRFRANKPSPAMVVAILALVFAVTGSAVAGIATISVLSKKEKKQTRNIAKDEIKKLAPGLTVANAGTAANAANAAKVGGADVCSGTLSLVNNEVRTVCGAAPVSVEASCGINPTFTTMEVSVVSETSDAWAFGEAIDDTGAETAIFEPLLDNISETLVQRLDSNASATIAEGGGAWVSAGAPGGPSVNGEFSIRVNHTGTNQGTCLVSMGAIAR